MLLLLWLQRTNINIIDQKKYWLGELSFYILDFTYNYKLSLLLIYYQNYGEKIMTKKINIQFVMNLDETSAKKLEVEADRIKSSKAAVIRRLIAEMGDEK